MSESLEFNIHGSKAVYDELEPYLTRGGVIYERSPLIQFSSDAPTAEIVVVTCVAIRALAPVLAAYLKERKRRVVVAKTDGTKLTAENYTADEVERLLRASAGDGCEDLYIEDANDKSPSA